MNERVVHIMNVARMTPNVNERTGETVKTARVLKDESYSWCVYTK